MRQPVPDLWHKVAVGVAAIPSGRVVTFGDLARWLGDVKASSWLGEWARDHDHVDECACHRLVRATGELGGYLFDPLEKVRRLQAEGVVVCEDRVELERYQYLLPESPHSPLSALREYQKHAAEQALIEPLTSRVGKVGGIDLSYVPGSRTREAVACLVCLDATTAELLWSQTRVAPVSFPYITSYLAFRELPLMSQLVDAVRDTHELPDVLLVDGSGVLHPRRAGIAVMLGVECEVPTIGVSKKRLVGNVDETSLAAHGFCEVTVSGRCLGHAIEPKTRSKRPCYASPGSQVSVENARSVTQAMMRAHRVPEPIYWADRLSREAARTKLPKR